MKIGETPVLIQKGLVWRANGRSSYDSRWLCSDTVKQLFHVKGVKSIIGKAYTHRMPNSRPLRVEFYDRGYGQVTTSWTNKKMAAYFPNAFYMGVRAILLGFFRDKKKNIDGIKTIWVTLTDAKTKKTIPPKRSNCWW